jgi:uncharacterized protein YkwD
MAADHQQVPDRTIRRRPVAALLALVVLVAALLPTGALAAGPTSTQLRDAEALVLTRINEERADQDLLPIRMDGRVRAVAQARSADMVARHYFDHVDPDGLAPWDHLDAAGITWWGAGEIIALNSVSPIRDAARRAVDQWMHSSGHYARIMDTSYNYAGVGVAMDGGISYWTVVFIQGPDRTDPFASITSLSSARGSHAARVRWEGADRRLATLTSGLASFDVQRRRAGGTWVTVRSRATGSAATLSGRKGVRYQFRVRSRDRAGNVGGWSPPRSVTIR